MVSDMASAIDAPADLRRLLTELLLAACTMNRVEQAREILGGYSVLAPGSREVKIGGALIELTSGDTDAAIARLRPLAEARDWYGITFLALALKIGGRAEESKTVLASMPIVTLSGISEADQPVLALADALRDTVHPSRSGAAQPTRRIE
jgi:hypothetical protein